jgi:methionine-rich copper-binding protein CopC
MRFNNRIEKRVSAVRLVDAAGAAQAARIAADGEPNELRALVPPLGAGLWRVEWRVLSADGHVVRGTFSFRVTPAGAR